MSADQKTEIQAIDENLTRMLSILNGNAKAAALATLLWEHFGGRLKCEIVDDDKKPSKCRTKVSTFKGVKTLEFTLILRKNDRLEAALVHELLHVDLFRRGYPTFYLCTQDRDLWQQGEDILNLAEHRIMIREFLAMGYTEDRFVGPSKPMNEKGQVVLRDLAAMGELLFTPQGYSDCMSDYLRQRGIACKLL